MSEWTIFAANFCHIHTYILLYMCACTYVCMYTYTLFVFYAFINNLKWFFCATSKRRKVSMSAQLSCRCYPTKQQLLNNNNNKSNNSKNNSKLEEEAKKSKSCAKFIIQLSPLLLLSREGGLVFVFGICISVALISFFCSCSFHVLLSCEVHTYINSSRAVPANECVLVSPVIPCSFHNSNGNTCR